jgi:serine/threonine protein kinase
MNETKSNPHDKDELTGQIFGGCRIIKKIGEGGMGVVYLAHHLALNKNVAIKILPPSFAREEERVKRFIREARSAAQLEHSNIIQIYNIAKHDDFYFIIMQYVEGESLAVKIRREGKINLQEALKITSNIASALSIAHHKGIVHRDIKPENIMITRNGEIKLMDFGLVRVLDVASQLSQSGDILGTPYYLSPEQARGGKVDGRADIYALGVTLFYMLTGKRPFDGDSTVSIILKHINEKPPPIRNFNPEITENISCLINKMLEKEVTNRYQSAEELIKDINLILAGNPQVQTMVNSQVKTKVKSIFTLKFLITAAISAILIVVIISIIKKNKQSGMHQPESNQVDLRDISLDEKEKNINAKIIKQRCHECYHFLVDKNYEQIKSYIYIPKFKQMSEERARLLIGGYLKRTRQFYESLGGRLADVEIGDAKIEGRSANIPFINAVVEIKFFIYNSKQLPGVKDNYRMISQIHRWILEDGIWYWYINPHKPDDNGNHEDGLKDK